MLCNYIVSTCFTLGSRARTHIDKLFSSLLDEISFIEFLIFVTDYIYIYLFYVIYLMTVLSVSYTHLYYTQRRNYPLQTH